jgi:hypothetical protein
MGVGSVLVACNGKGSGGSPGTDAGFTDDAAMSSDTGSSGDGGTTTCPWTPGNRPCSKVTVGLTQGALMPSAGCVVDDSAGTVTIPASMLGMFTGTSGTAVIERVDGTHTLASNADIGVAVINVQTTTTMYTP